MISRLANRPLIRAIFIAFVAFNISGCGGGGSAVVPASYATAARPDGSIWKLIDRNMPLDQQNDIYDALYALPALARGDIAIVEEDRVLANNPAVASDAFRYIPTSDPTVFIQPNGETIILPSPAEESSVADARHYLAGEHAGTGIAHSTYSGPGFSIMTTSVNLDCFDSLLNGEVAPFQGGYIYGGGTSSNSSEADVGILFNHVPGVLARPTSVQLYINAVLSVGAPIGLYNSHLTCGSTIELLTFPVEFAYPGHASQPYLVDAEIENGGYARALLQPMQRSSGWSMLCSHCQTKHVTTLAVTTPNTGDIIPGTYFGVSQPYCNSPDPPEAAIEWSNISEGYFISSNPGVPPVMRSWRGGQVVDLPSQGVKLHYLLYSTPYTNHEFVGLNESGACLRLASKGRANTL